MTLQVSVEGNEQVEMGDLGLLLVAEISRDVRCDAAR